MNLSSSIDLEYFDLLDAVDFVWIENNYWLYCGLSWDFVEQLVWLFFESPQKLMMHRLQPSSLFGHSFRYEYDIS